MQRLFFFLSLIWLPLPTEADAPVVAGFTVTDLGATPNEYNSPGALALNDVGQVVGGSGHAFLWDNGKTADLGSLRPEGPEDDTKSIAYGINNQGQIVGSSGSFGPIVMSGLQFARGILYERGTLRQFTTKNSSFEPYAINDKSQIVGLDSYRGFFYENGRLTEIGTLSRVPVGNRSTARALNSHRQVVGWSTVNSRLHDTSKELPAHAFLWQRNAKAGRRRERQDEMRDLGTLPGWINSYAYGINDRGEVVGSVSDATGRPYGVDIDPTDTDGRADAFLWRDGKMTSLGTLPGSRDSEAYGIDDSGTIVGRSDGKAVAWQEGKIRDLNAFIPAGSGWVLQEARAINRKGQIVGIGTLAGKPHSFLLTPRLGRAR